MGLDVNFVDLADTTSFFSGNYDTISVVITICCALAIYNAFELLLLIFTTFRRFRGLYFWSLLVASSGVVPYTIGFMIEYFKLTYQVAGLIITFVGWPMMVTGQSLVLYSRLHVVLGKGSHRILKAVKWMIIVDAIVLTISTEVAVAGAYYASPRLHFAAAYRSIEKIQMTIFTIQELILSGIYLWKTLDILKLTVRRRTSRIMWQLFSINVLIVSMDIVLLVVEFQNRHVIEQALKAVIYSVKLKLEFAILSKLVGLTKHSRSDNAGVIALEDHEDNDFLDTSAAQRADSAMTFDLGIQPHRVLTAQSDTEKGSDAEFVENDFALSSAAKRISSAERPPTAHTHTAAVTIDEQRKRRTMEEDLYAGALKEVG